MKEVTLYKRNAQGKLLVWSIKDNEQGYTVNYGIVGHNLRQEQVGNTMVKVNQFDSMVKSKRNDGYKAIADLYDNAPEFINGETNLINYLNTYLPINNTTSTGFVLPMLCKTLEDNKPFVKNYYFGQWKINGERCIIGAERIIGDMFKDHIFTYHSRKGIDWTSKMSWFDAILDTHIRPETLDMMIEEGVCLDGELYLPGYKINDINSIIKNDKLLQHYQLQFWCYDICIDNMSAIARSSLRQTAFNLNLSYFETEQEHLNNKQQIIILPDEDIINFNDAIKHRDRYISLGFEGLVIRKEDAEYQFGNKRNLSMLKFKKTVDGKFIIIDIVSEGKKRENLAKFILKNDINEMQFACTINATHSEQESILINKNKYIGKHLLVEYRERSGVNELPFHAKGIKIIE